MFDEADSLQRRNGLVYPMRRYAMKRIVAVGKIATVWYENPFPYPPLERILSPLPVGFGKAFPERPRTPVGFAVKPSSHEESPDSQRMKRMEPTGNRAGLRPPEQGGHWGVLSPFFRGGDLLRFLTSSGPV